MNNKFKKFLAMMAMVPCAFLAVACGGDPPPENEDPYDESVVTPAQYIELHSKLKLLKETDLQYDEYKDMYGKFGDILVYGTIDDYVVYSNGILYDYGASNSMDGADCVEWDIGKNLKIVYFDGVYDILVVENSSGELFVYQNVVEDHIAEVKTRKLYSVKLNCIRESLIDVRSYNYGENIGIDYYHKSNGGVKFHRVNMIDGTEQICDVYASGDREGYYGSYITKVLDIFTEDGSIYYMLTEENEWICSNYDLRDSDIEEGKRIITMSAGLYIPEYNNVSKIFAGFSIYGFIVSVNGDNNNLYFYQEYPEDKYTSEETWYNEATKIQLPTGYTLADIKNFYQDESGNDAILLEMNDGVFYIFDLTDVKYAEMGEVLQLTEVEGLKDVVATSNVVRIYIDDGDIMVLMNDKNLYEFEFNY